MQTYSGFSRYSSHNKAWQHFLPALALTLSVLSLLLPHPPSLEAQEPKPKKQRAYGSYHEQTLDLEVKVDGGAIRVWRVWQGEHKRWLINPQHEALEKADPYYSDQYKALVYGELLRGGKRYKGISRASSGGAGSEGGGQYKGAKIGDVQLPSAPLALKLVKSLIADLGVISCQQQENSGKSGFFLNPAGYKFANGQSGLGRDWAQYDFAGLLIEWGEGNKRIGMVVYEGLTESDKVISGYKDSTGALVVSFERDAQKRIRFVRDLHAKRSVEYRYNANGFINEVLDPDGVSTTYEYENGQIKRKTVGDPSSTDPGDSSATNFKYYPDGKLYSSLDDQGRGSFFKHEYLKQQKLYLQTETSHANVVTRRYLDASGALAQEERNDALTLRLVKICEDSAIIDQHNRVTFFDRDGYERLQSIIFPNGKSTSFTHSIEDWPEVDKPWDTPTKPWGITELRTASGLRVNYERDPEGRLRLATEHLPEGGQRIWKFDYNGKKRTQQLVSGDKPNLEEDLIEEWEEDDYGNIARYTNSKGATWEYLYNSQGQVISVREPAKEAGPAAGTQPIWTFDYYPSGLLKYVSEPEGYERFYKYTKRGLLKELREVYETGKEAITLYRYNRRGLLEELTDASGTRWQFGYDQYDFLSQITYPSGSQRKWTNDPSGRVLSETDERGVITTTEYFDTNVPGATRQSARPFAPQVRVTHPRYTEEIYFGLRQELLKRVLKPKTGPPEETSFEYDAELQLTKTTLPDGSVITHSYDGLGRLRSSTSPGWGTTEYTHEAGGRKFTIKDALGGETVYLFNKHGELSELRAAGSAEPFSSNITKYEYYQDGSLAGIVSPNQKRLKYFYDRAQRLRSLELYPSLAATTPSETLEYSYNLRGNLTAYSNSQGSSSLSVDALGRTTQLETNYGAFTKQHRYQYGNHGERSHYFAPEGTEYRYQYDAAGLPQTITIPGEGSLSYSYEDPHYALPTLLQFPGGTQQRYAYDDLGQLVSHKASYRSEATFLDTTYKYQFSRLTEEETKEGTRRFSWDEGDRLITLEDPVQETERFSYDALGNRYTAALAEPERERYDVSGALLSADAATYHYDQQGNRVRTERAAEPAAAKQYRYNELDQLVAVEDNAGTTLARYGYDAMGLRIWKEVFAGASAEKTYFHHTEDGLSAEFKADGSLLRSYLYAPANLRGSLWGTDPLVVRTASAAYYSINNHLGAPRFLVDSGGSSVWSANYSAYGARVSGTSTIENPLRLPGQYFDPETGLHQNTMRQYDPQAGLYLQQDPYGSMITGPNRYGYAYGDPIQLTDPTGEIAPAVVWVAAFAIGEAISGFPTIKCGLFLYDPCLYPDYLKSCGQAVVGGLFGYGVGKIVGKVVGGVGPRALRLPATDATLLGTRTLGYTTPNGSVFIRPGLSRAEQVMVMRHESVHAWFSPRGSTTFQTVRQNLGQWGYNSSQLLRYAEEAMAQGYATRSLMQGLSFPLANGYVSAGGLLLEGSVVGVGAYGIYQMGDR